MVGRIIDEDESVVLLTPTEDLILDVLVARYRLGENVWTFESRHKKALNQLQGRGFINVMSGIVEKTVRASLTEAGKKEYLSESYVSPLEEEAGELRRKSHGNTFGRRGVGW